MPEASASLASLAPALLFTKRCSYPSMCLCPLKGLWACGGQWPSLSIFKLPTPGTAQAARECTINTHWIQIRYAYACMSLSAACFSTVWVHSVSDLILKTRKDSHHIFFTFRDIVNSNISFKYFICYDITPNPHWLPSEKIVNFSLNSLP